MKKILIAVLVAVGSSAWASITDEVRSVRDSRDKEVTPGVWHADLVKARAYAEANDLPLVAVWSNGDECGHCVAFENCIMSPAFRNWIKDSGIVFYLGLRTDDGSDGQEGYHGTSFYWCCNNQNATLEWPYVRVWWKSHGLDVIHPGAWYDGEDGGHLLYCYQDGILDVENFIAPSDNGTYNPGGRRIISKLVGTQTATAVMPVGGGMATGGLLAGFTPNNYAGGEFGFVYFPPYVDGGAQIERDTDQTSLVVQLVRDENLKTIATYNWLRTVYPNGHAETNMVDWAVGEVAKSASVKLDKAWLEGAADVVSLELYSDKVELKDESAIWIVDKVPNSPSNPLFVGERTASTLGWGEWTMDAAAAMQKVAAAGGSESNAYTLVLCGGELWCPDCANTDKYLFDTPEFKNWATNTHNVALVVIDIPNGSAANGPDGTSACLLTSVIGMPSAGWRTALGKGEEGTYQCGVAYQTRHGVTAAQADEVYVRNKSYAAGLLNRIVPNWDNKKNGIADRNPYRPGVPSIYVIRPDATIAGRIAEFATTSPKAENENYLTRLDELLALVDDPEEEKDGCCRTTTRTIAGSNKRGVSGTLSCADETDVYRINAKEGSEITFTISGDDAALVELAVFDGSQDENPEWDKDYQWRVAVGTNTISSGASVFCTLPSDDCFVSVRAVDPTYFKAAKEGSTVAAYTLKSDGVIVPGETYQETEPIDCAGGGCIDLGDAATNVWVKLEKDQKYKFTGLAADNAENAAALSYDAETGVYTAKADGQAKLVLEPDGAGVVVFGYQRWVVGLVEFYPKAATVRERGDDAEHDTVCDILIRRSGGVSGWAGAQINMVPEKCSRPEDAYVWNDESRWFFWPEGVSDVQKATVRIKADTHADGPTKLVFKLTKLEDDGEGHVCTTPVDEEEFVLTIIDDDESNAGRAALVKAGGIAIPGSRKVVAKGGTKGYELGLSRLGGSDSSLLVKIVGVGGTELGAATWAPREGTETEKTVALDLPEYVEGGYNRVEVGLVGEAGSKVEAKYKYLTIDLIPEGAALFSDASATLSGTRYVDGSDLAVALDGATLSGGDVEIVKLAGSVAPGMTWSGAIGATDCDPGTPGLEISGTPTKGGTYTAVFQVVQDGVAGGTVQVTMTVDDPVEPEDDGTDALNPYLAVTRTVSDIMVVDTERERLVGLLTVTVPRSGRLSGKYRSIDGATVPLLSEAWDSCVAGDYVATMTDVDGYGYTAVVTAKQDGAIEVEFEDPEVEDKQACLQRSSVWGSDEGAVAWKGYYTVSLPFQSKIESDTAFANGTGYITFRMTDDEAVRCGRVAYAGVMANGKAFSGTATLEALTAKAALLPVFSVSESDTLTGVFSFDKSKTYREVEPYEIGYPYWRHDEKLPEASYSGKLNAYGCLYRKGEILKCCTDTFASQYLTFFTLAGELVDSDKFGTRATLYPDGKPVWSTNNVESVTVKVTNEGNVDNVLLYAPDVARNVHGLTLNFNPDTGLVTGQLWLDFYETATTGSRVTATYRGIVKPGWGKIPGECGSCSDVETTQESPFITGACFFPDTYEYERNMQKRWLQIKRGCPFSIGVEEGQ